MIGRRRPTTRSGGARRGAGLVAAALALALVAAGCGDDTANDPADGNDPDTSAAESTAGTADDPVECTVTETVASGERTVATPEGERRYLLAVPADEPPSALLFDFHGTESTAEFEDAVTQFSRSAPARGYAVVTPQAVGTPTRWTVPGIPGPDDVAFVESLAASLWDELCGAPLPTFATGWSSGAAMSAQLGCVSDVFGAVAPIGGMNLHRRCPDAPPVSMLAFHGTADTASPYEGQPGWEEREPRPNAFVIGDVMTMMASVAERGGCDPTPVEEPLGDQTVRVEWPNCDDGVEVALVRVDGGGHNLPGTAERLGGDPSSYVGVVSDDLDGPAAILDFFDRHR